MRDTTGGNGGAQWPVVRRLREQSEAWGGPHRATRHRLGIHWWRELLLIGLWYFGYNLVRNHFGSAAVGPVHALNNAEIVIELERALGLYFESTMQGWFLGWDAFISFWNVFYGLAHFSVTFFTLVWLYLKFPEVYQRWRTTGLACTGLGLVGFALFPLMPPRLLGDCGPYGACLPDAGFVDTMIHYEGLWSFDSGTFQALSNQYAAMPSIHFAWAFWCFLALRGRIRSNWGRVCLYLYPAADAVRRGGDRQPLLDRRRRGRSCASCWRWRGPHRWCAWSRQQPGAPAGARPSRRRDRGPERPSGVHRPGAVRRTG